MAKLVKFKDSKFVCWSRVDLDNGEPIWISVARTGVLVKKSKWGLMGEKLYNANAYEANRTAGALVTIYSDEYIKGKYDVIQNIANHLLFAFTLAAMASESASQLSTRLKGAPSALDSIVEKSLQFKGKLGKYLGWSSSPLPGGELGNSALESVNEKSNKFEGNSRINLKKIQEKIINKEDADNIFSLNKQEWDSYVKQMVFPDGWKKMHSEYHYVGAFDQNTHMGLSIQPLFKDDSSPPTSLIVGSYYPLGTLPIFTDDFKSTIEKEAADDLGPEYSISAIFVKTHPFEIIELSISKK